MKGSELKKRLRIFRNHKSTVAGLFFLLVAFGCAGKTPVPVAPRDAEDRLHSLREARVHLKSLKGEARVEIRRKGRRFKFHASILAEHPDRLYAEVTGVGMTSAAVSVVDGKALVYLPSRGEAYEGDPDDILEKLLGISQPARAWVGTLLGELPPYDEPILTAKNVGSRMRMTLGKRKPKIKLTFDRRTSWLQIFQEFSGPRRTFTFGKPIGTAAGDYPSMVRVEVSKRRSVTFRFKKVIPNAKILPKFFGIDLPPGVEPKPLRNAELLLGG